MLRKCFFLQCFISMVFFQQINKFNLNRNFIDYMELQKQQSYLQKQELIYQKTGAVYIRKQELIYQKTGADISEKGANIYQKKEDDISENKI